VNSWWDEQHQQRRAAITAVLASPRGHQYLDYTGGDREFAAWLQVADTICVRRFGLSIFDIADWPGVLHTRLATGPADRWARSSWLTTTPGAPPTSRPASPRPSVTSLADSREHAEWLATFTVGEHARPTSAVKAWAATTPERHTICPTDA